MASMRSSDLGGTVDLIFWEWGEAPRPSAKARRLKEHPGSDVRSHRQAAASPFDRLSEARRNLLGQGLRQFTLREDSAGA
jgi:hypothetical protein